MTRRRGAAVSGRIVSVGDIPRGPGALDDVVRMIVDLPPGSGQGPKVRSGLHRHAHIWPTDGSTRA